MTRILYIHLRINTLIWQKSGLQNIQHSVCVPFIRQPPSETTYIHTLLQYFKDIFPWEASQENI